MYGRPVSPEAFEKYESSSDEDEDIESLIPKEALPLTESDSEVYGTETSNRLAIIDLPWKKITATDIFAIISKVLEDRSNELLSVTVYVSKYGQEHPEEPEGPPQNVDEEIQIAIWRRKEKENLKRHFAICCFESTNCSELAYKLLQQNEIETTGNVFNVSYVSTDEDFTTFPIRDEATSYPDNWEMPNISSDFLNKTKPDEDWDSNPRERTEAIEAIWENPDDEVAAQLILGSGSEDERPLSRADLQSTLDALNEEEEVNSEFDISNESDETENESEKEVEVTFEHTLPQNLEASTKAAKLMKKQKKEEMKRKEADLDTINEYVDDERFKEFFGKQGYGINVADAKFKRTPEMEKFMDVVSRRSTKTDDIKERAEEIQNEIESTVDRIRRRANENLKNKK
ncbi:Pre-rRNA-processing protein ESF1 [Histomonas meleagridis]|uniref:Pre-rRNA-processing protein ESF1 n=1 Tax=Histomonas meleagridis TaxID=135588 RepID=UPI00355A2135|nr:Pre-rRNA-processing protein ESF1 [Histomonas meleagridis]KAH0796754.1 Pre-rRNA-processing protein ESF1 [Histomonas meleagridis]